MKIGLVGLQNSGKTTIFNALTRSEARVAAYSEAGVGPNLAVLDVPDSRVDRLAEIYRPEKTVYAALELVDFGGLTEGAAKSELFSGAAMAQIRNMDALAHVVWNFPDGSGAEPTPLQDIQKLDEEFLLSDLIVAEGRLERIEQGYRRGQKSNALLREEKILRKVQAHLAGDEPLRTLDLDRDEEKVIRGFQFLTRKPMMVILNSSESGFGKNGDLLEEIEDSYKVVEFAGHFEMELSRLEDEEEIRLFMEDMGIEVSVRDRLCRAAYELLGYISFFTVGKDEVRAWNIRKGGTALEAAGIIHSDLARGFIRAECFSYQDLIECGSEKEVRSRGLLRLEGRTYRVKDGDILNIRFNV
ncbi:MAG: redox-regulated ATPase YchF [Deltaproteobacteria bacterium]|nr:redox-regulated ATPase YchF [Deltaproteobacteria bacterium]